MKRKKITLEFSPDWIFLNELEKYLQSLFMYEVNEDYLVQGQVASIIELLENAVKYSDDSYEDNCITLCIEFNTKKSEIIVMVKNHSKAQDIDVLKSEVQEVTKGDPQAHFFHRLMRPENKKGHGAQLGLTRLLYEGKGKLSLDVCNDNIVTMTAIFNYNPNIEENNEV